MRKVPEKGILSEGTESIFQKQLQSKPLVELSCPCFPPSPHLCPWLEKQERSRQEKGGSILSQYSITQSNKNKTWSSHGK